MVGNPEKVQRSDGLEDCGAVSGPITVPLDAKICAALQHHLFKNRREEGKKKIKESTEDVSQIKTII